MKISPSYVQSQSDEIDEDVKTLKIDAEILKTA